MKSLSKTNAKNPTTMKNIAQALLVALFFALILITNSAHAQNVRTLSPFDAISITGNIDVTLQAGDTETLTLKAEGIPEDKVSIKVANGELKVKLLNSIFYKNDKVTVLITYKNLRKLRGLAGANIESTSTIEADKLALKVGSGALVELAVQTNALEASVGEGGVLELTGNTESQKISVGTGGHVEALRLDSNRTYVKASTGGHAEVVALKSIEATANTGGKIEYKGDPEESTTKTVMSGDVRKL